MPLLKQAKWRLSAVFLLTLSCSFSSASPIESSGSGENPTLPAPSTATDIEEISKAFTTTPVSNMTGIPTSYGDKLCGSIHLTQENNRLHWEDLSENLSELLKKSGINVSDEQLAAIKQRCDITDGAQVLNLVPDSEDFVCSIAAQNTLERPHKPLIYLLTDSDYTLHAGIGFSGKNLDTKFCGIVDLISDDNSSGESSTSEQYLVNDQALDIPARNRLTQLKFRPSAGSSEVINYRLNSVLGFAGLTIDISKTSPTRFFTTPSYQGNSGLSFFESHLVAGDQQLISASSNRVIRIKNSVIERTGGERYPLVRGFGHSSLAIEGSVFINRALPGQTTTSQAMIRLVFPHHDVAPDHIINSRFEAFGYDAYTALSLFGWDRWTTSRLLISGNEFAEGITVPIDARSIFRDNHNYKVVVREGSTGNTWQFPTGAIVATGCHRGVLHGQVGFQNGIVCGADSDQVATAGISTAETNLSTIKSTPKVYGRLASDAVSFESTTSGSAPGILPASMVLYLSVLPVLIKQLL